MGVAPPKIAVFQSCELGAGKKRQHFVWFRVTLLDVFLEPARKHRPPGHNLVGELQVTFPGLKHAVTRFERASHDQ